MVAPLFPMYRVFACILAVDGTVCCTWVISVRSFTELCSGAMFAGVRRRHAPTNLDGTEWWSVTAGIVVCNGASVCPGVYGGVAPKYAGRDVYNEVGTAPDLARDRQRKARNAMMTPIAIPRITPPTIAPTIMPMLEGVLLSAFAIELDCATELFLMLVAVRVGPPLTVVRASNGGKGGSMAGADPGRGEVERAPPGWVRINESIFTP